MSGPPPVSRTLLWGLPYLVALLTWVPTRFSHPASSASLEVVGFWGLVFIPAVVPVLAAIFDGRREALAAVLVSTWLTWVVEVGVLAWSTSYLWDRYGYADMSMILVPMAAGHYLGCSVLAALAFGVSRWIRGPQPDRYAQLAAMHSERD